MRFTISDREGVKKTADLTPEMVSSKLLDKYVLPKVALTVITIAAAAGVTLSALRQGDPAWGLVAAKWAAFLALAAWTGLTFWRTALLPPAVAIRPTEGAQDYGLDQVRRFRRFERVAALTLFPTLAYTLLAVAGAAGAAGAVSAAPAPYSSGAMVLLTALGIAYLTRPGREESWAQVRAGTGRAVLTMALGLILLGALAFMEVALQEGEGGLPWLLALNRWLHMAAFSLWFGGAVWNIFIAVPSGLERLNMDTIITANAQLERFRWAVRVILPTILVTGLVQGYHIVGLRPLALIDTTLGRLIALKLGLIVALVVIFITCPMWRACSPIAGVCNLDDLE